MDWIAGWNKRIKLTISGSCIGGDLSNFPVLVHLDSTCSGVFNELGSNSKRISVVAPDMQQCYIEVEDWNESTNSANLWVKVPTLSSGVSSDVYLYYDNLHPDNSAYVGTVGETPAQNVWDDNFVGVWHMNQDPTGGSDCIKDSTVNTISLTPNGSMDSTDLVDGKIGKAIDFDGSNDYFEAALNTKLHIVGDITTEAIIKKSITAPTYSEPFIGMGASGESLTTNWLYSMWVNTSKEIYSFHEYSTGSNISLVANGVNVCTNVFESVTISRDVSAKELKYYLDGAYNQNDIYSNNPEKASSGNLQTLFVGCNESGGSNFKGIIEEIRISNTLRSAPWIKATYYSNWNQLLTYGVEETVSSGFLPGWNNRLKLTIQSDYIDNTLTDFPVMIKLSEDSGYNSFDNRSVFYELETNINRKKIAVTDSTGILQCFVEIERFSCAETEAVLWTRLPVVYSSTGTHFYLYYDKTVADNLSFVGDVNSISAQNVWDSNFVGVWHMNQDPTGGSNCIKDSTSNTNHGTPAGSMTSGDLVAGKVGKALDFEGTDDYINIGNVGMDFGNRGLTAEIIAKIPNVATIRTFLHRQDNLNSYNPLIKFSIDSSGYIKFFVRGQTNPTSYLDLTSTNANYDDNTWKYIVGQFNDSDNSGKLEVNNISVATAGSITTTDLNFGQADLNIGRLYQGWVPNDVEYYTGNLDEIRISDTVRSTPWIKATYYSNWDDLIVYEKEDITPSWLDDWSKRIKLTIDHTKIDSSLVDFPVLVTLASGVQSNFFDELYLSRGITWYDHAMVCGINQEGTYDTLYAYTPSVIKDGDTYKMWYSGSDGTNIRILYATSTNGTTWANHQMVIDKNVEGTYDTVHNYYPSVIKDGDTYKMWYSGNDGTNIRILYATSTNGTTWANHQLVINYNVEGTYDTVHVYSPSVIKDGDTYKMWYSGKDGTNTRILYATSTNGTTWANHQMVIDKNVEGAYDTVHIYYPSVIKDGDTYKVWYSGNDGTNTRILYATSTNGTTWANHQMVIDKNVEGTYDTAYAYAPSVIKDGDTYKVWYSGYAGTNIRILYAYSNDSYNNRKKIVVTKNDGTTQIPVEIEQWDFYNGKVNLWTKIPTVVFDTDTDIYLYYDSSKDDNTAYVGDVGSTPAQNVWDSNFVGVWHMNQDPTGGASCIKDSTLNSNNGTPGGSMTSGDLVDGKIGKALDFDGSANCLSVSADNSLKFGFGDFTVEGIFKTSSSNTQALLSYGDRADNPGWTSYIGANGVAKFIIDDATTQVVIEDATDHADGFLHSYAAVLDRDANGLIYIDGTQTAINNISGANLTLDTIDHDDIEISRAWYNAGYTVYFGGVTDEIRISNTARSVSWIKATYYSNWNTLLTYGSVQNYSPPPDYYYHGYVKEEGVYVSRKLYLYRRDTGAFIDSCMSNASTGYYLLETLVSGEHFIVALDDYAGDDYNALVQDRIYPNGI